MKRLLLLTPFTLAACSSFEPPNVNLETDKQAFHMTTQVVYTIPEGLVSKIQGAEGSNGDETDRSNHILMTWSTASVSNELWSMMMSC